MVQENNQPVAMATELMTQLEPAQPSFSEVARKIIKSSIRSAICIDDRFAEPYMSDDEIKTIVDKDGIQFDKDIPKNLYNSFRKNGECDLDIYCFRSLEESWHPSYMLNNKDMVVLDWELDGKLGYKSTLTILQDIIKQDKIPFIIIYTHKPESDFGDITKELIKHFNKYNKANIESILSEFKSLFKEHIQKLTTSRNIDVDDITIFLEDQNTIKILKTALSTPTQKSTAENELYESISETFDINNSDGVRKKFETILNKSLIKNIEDLAYLLLGTESEIAYQLKRIEIDSIGYRINNSIITLFSKPGTENKGVSPEDVFDQFSILISNSPHNFITVLSLEMRDRFREDFSKIGNDISQINERAFFKHLENYKNRSADNYLEQFYDFLLKSWANELVEYNLNLKPLIFSTIEVYRTDNNLVGINGTEISDDLADLAARLSTSTLIDRMAKDKKIRFGDLFEIVDLLDNGLETAKNQYLLSITPHCICVDECKIENNFYFIKSENTETKHTSALKNVETGHYSFFKQSEIIKSVKWGECKPFTLYIEKNDISNLTTIIGKQKIKLNYITTLKENFAQRISNKAFGYGTSIGIDLPHL